MNSMGKMRQRFRTFIGAIVSKLLRWALSLPGVKDVLAAYRTAILLRELLQQPVMDPELAQAFVRMLNAHGLTPTGGILGYHAYTEALTKGLFTVGPFPERYAAPGKPEGETPFGPTTITLSLGKTFIGLKPGVIIDLMERRIQDYLSDPEFSFCHELAIGDKVAILPKGYSKEEYARMERELWLEYGDNLKLVVVGFVNGETLQTVEFPLPQNGETAHAGFVTNLTRVARCGMDVEKAPRLHTGDCHRITLEFENSGPTIFILTVGEQPVANLTIVPVIGAPTHSESTFRGQNGPSGVAVPYEFDPSSGNGALLVMSPTATF